MSPKNKYDLEVEKIIEALEANPSGDLMAAYDEDEDVLAELEALQED